MPTGSGAIHWHDPQAIIAAIKFSGVLIGVLIPIATAFGWMLHRIIGRVVNQFEKNMETRFSNFDRSLQELHDKIDKIESRHEETRTKVNNVEKDLSELKGRYVTRNEFENFVTSLNGKFDNLQSLLIQVFANKADITEQRDWSKEDELKRESGKDLSPYPDSDSEDDE